MNRVLKLGRLSGLAAVTAMAVAATALSAKTFGEWSAPVRADPPSSHADVNTPFVDGCPILSPYDGSLYMASNRPGSAINPSTGLRSLDIWIAPKVGDGWGAPVNAGPTINTGADEFCPSPARGNRFFFVRRLSATNTDIYVVKKLPKGWGTPERLQTGGDAINSPAEEWSPAWFEAGGREYLYFSTTREGRMVGGALAHDIYYSVDGGPAFKAPGVVNGSDSNARPNVRHDGLEIVWDSNRFGTLGASDIFSATRSSVDAPWTNAQHLGNGINSSAPESRPSLSWDGTRLMFGSNRAGEGATDIYTSTRVKNP